MPVGVLTASTALGRLDELLESGFRVTDISSTWEHVTVELATDDRRITLELGTEDARSLLAGEESRAAKRVTAPS